MATVLALLSHALVLLILVDSFETIVVPRRVTHRWRFSRFFYLGAWACWRMLALRLPAGSWRESFLSLFGPLSLLGLLIAWVLGLILGFAVLQWSLAVDVRSADEEISLGTFIYLSGVTFFTLGYGDVLPVTALGRGLAVTEAGMGFGFLAVIIGYLPVIYQTFSRRETLIALLDARAGSPPSAGQLLLRLARSGDITQIDPFLAEWERWSAELLESHLSFPVLAFYRSQHDNQSWLAALTAMLDSCAFLLVAVKGHNPYQSQLTFAMARHALVDLALVFKATPVHPADDRLPDQRYQHLRSQLQEVGLRLHDGPSVAARLRELRGMYEPFVLALGQRFLFALPPFAPVDESADNWQRSAWMKPVARLGNLPIASTGDGHFE